MVADGALGLGDRGVDVTEIELTHGQQTAVAVRDEVRTPTVVGASNRRGELRIEAPGSDLHQAPTGIERHELDVLLF